MLKTTQVLLLQWSKVASQQKRVMRRLLVLTTALYARKSIYILGVLVLSRLHDVRAKDLAEKFPALQLLLVSNG